MAHVTTITGTGKHASKHARVTYNVGFQEYTVLFYTDRKLHRGASYHTGDKVDAIGTARHFCGFVVPKQPDAEIVLQVSIVEALHQSNMSLAYLVSGFVLRGEYRVAEVLRALAKLIDNGVIVYFAEIQQFGQKQK